MVDNLSSLKFNQLFKYRITYQIIIAIQEIILLSYFFISSSTLYQKLAGLFILFSFLIRIILSGFIIKEQCQQNQRKYSGSNEEHLNSKSYSMDKMTNNLENWKLGNRIKEEPQVIRREWSKIIKQLFVLIPQIIAKLNLLNAIIQAQNGSLILFLNYFFDDKTFLLFGAKKFLNINLLICNMLIKFFPFFMILVAYLKDNSIFNKNLSFSIHLYDIVWIGIIIVMYFIGDQFYHFASQNIQANGELTKQYLSQERQNNVQIADYFIISFYSKHQNQSDLSPGDFNNNNNNNNKSSNINNHNHKLSYNGTNSQIFQGINNNSNIMKQTSPAKKNPILKKNISHSKSGIIENCDQQQARSFESSIDDVQNSFFLQDIMDLIPYGIAILNSQHNVIYNNNKILELLDCDKQNVIKIITGLSTANTQSSQPSNNIQKSQRPSTSQFANKKYESSIENILTQPYHEDQQGGAISKNSFLCNENQMGNSANLHGQTSGIRINGTNGNQVFNNSQIHINMNLNNNTSGNPMMGKQQSNQNDSQQESYYSGEKIQTDKNQENSFEKNNYQDDSKQKESNLEFIKQLRERQNKQSSLSSPEQSQKSQDGQDMKYKQSTGKFGGSISDMPLEQWNTNMKFSNKEQIKLTKQQTLDSKNKMMTSLTFKGNTHFKNGNGTIKNVNSNLVNQCCDSENNTGSKEDCASPFIQSEKNNIQDIRNINQEQKGDFKLVDYQDQNGSLTQKNSNNNKDEDEENKFISDKSFLQINLNKTQDNFASDISRIEDKNNNNNESITYLKSNPVTNQNLDDLNSGLGNKEHTMRVQEKYVAENTFPQSENQFISFDEKKSHNLNKKGVKLKSKFSKKVPSASNIQNCDVNKTSNNQKQNEELIKVHQTENICHSQPDENYHNHIQKKEIKKQISIFTPQLQQRNIKVGQLISSMFDNQIDDTTRTYGGVKKSNSKNLLITQLSEQIESNYSRNHSLLGQINSTKNIGFYQYKNNEASMQVVYKGKQLVVRLIPCEFQYDFEDNDSPPTVDQSLVLIQVEPFWEELFQEKIEDFSKRKMQLFGSLCHELRTPLNCSISFLDLYKQLKDGSEDEADVNEFIEPSLRSNQLMLNMVNDILDFVQMTENKFKFNPVQFNLIELLEECLLLIKVHADIKNINLQLKKNDLVPKYIVSDPNRIRQIILNFLSNSLKFTKNMGTISLEAQGLEQINLSQQQLQARQSSIIKITVSDTGIGISKKNIKKIFEIFNKTDHKDASINPNGCGIGLPLSNSLAKLVGPLQPLIIKENNGNQIQISSGIQVDSVEGKGSSFSFLIQDLNSKQLYEKDFRESCDIIEFVDNDLMQSQQDSNNMRIISQNNNHIPHLSIKQDVAGGMKINNFLSINTPGQYLCDNQSESRIKSYQNSAIKNSIKTIDINSSGPLERIPSNILLNKQRRITDGFKKATTEFEISLSKQIQQSAPKVSAQVFSFPQSSNYTPSYDNNSINNLNSPIGGIKQPLQMASKLSSPKNQFPLFEKRTDSKSMNVSNINNISSIAQIRNMNSVTMQSQATQDMDIQSLKGYNNQQIINQSQTALYPTQIPSQTMLKQQNSGSIQPQAQIQKALLDKNNNFSVNSKGEETKILIADDSGFNIMVLKKIIQLFHIQNIQICHDGQEAVTKVRDILNNPKERLYDIIFMDLDMPIMNGYEACKQIKQMIQNYEVPDQLYIIACSGYGVQVREEHAFHISQLDDAIAKPVKKDQVQNALQTFLREKIKNK